MHESPRVLVNTTQAGAKRKEALLQLAPLAMLITFGFLWACDADKNSVFATHPRLTSFTLGLVFSHLCNNMILSAMCRIDYPIVQWILVPLPFIFVNSYFKISPRHDEVVLGVYLGFVLVMVFFFVRNTIEEICELLQIYCLKLGRRNSGVSVAAKDK